MDILKEMLKSLDGEAKNSIFLREIALLMEEIDMLKGKLSIKENLIKNFEKQIQGGKNESNWVFWLHKQKN